MANYLLLYGGGSMPQSEEETKAVLAEWGDWYGRLAASIVDTGKPFSPNAKNVASDGTISDGPGGVMASGYTIVKANSLDEAAMMARDNPVLKSGGTVSIFETLDIPGM